MKWSEFLCGLTGFMFLASFADADPSAYVPQLSDTPTTAYIKQLSGFSVPAATAAVLVPPRQTHVKLAPEPTVPLRRSNQVRAIRQRTIDQLPHVRDGVRIFIVN